MFLPEKAPGEVHPSSREGESEFQEWQRQLLKAAEMLEKPGVWGQGVCGGVEGLHCMLTAVRTFRRSGNDDEAERRVLKAFGVSACMPVYDWNDTKGRTTEEVVAKLRAVALGG